MIMTNNENDAVRENSVKTAKQELQWLKAEHASWLPRPNVGKNERLISAGVGAAALIFGLSKGKGALGKALTAVGAALIARGATGYCPLNHAMGRDLARPEEYQDSDSGQKKPKRRPTPSSDPVDQASRESFPASDPPSSTGATS